MLAVILLATYNGDAYLEEQLDSILEQTHRQWLLIAKDDGSTDETVATMEAAGSDTKVGQQTMSTVDGRSSAIRASR